MNIEKLLCPKVGKLIKKKGSVTATLFDAELDYLNLSFTCTETVTIDTENLSYVCLTYENLYDMISLIEQSENYFDKKYKTK